MPATARRYATLKQAGEYLGVTDRCIRQMVAAGRITGYRNGTRIVRVDLNEIDAAMKPFGGDSAARDRTSPAREAGTS
jgi:excisionase family DNA binding protein